LLTCVRVKNLNFARDLLTRVELDAFTIKAPGRRHEVQLELTRNRELLEQMYDRMADLEQMGREDKDGGENGDEEEGDFGEDLLAGVVNLSGEEEGHDGGGDRPSYAQITGSKDLPTSMLPPPPPQTQISSELRQRKHATDMASGHTSARTALFSRRAHQHAAATTTATQSLTAEAILDRQRGEQGELSKRILENAGRLKESSQAFSRLLAEDRDIIDRASSAMDTTGRRMDAAGSRLGLLARMTEGEGWLGRMKLYAMVYALLVACVVVVFASPKIRF
jgi:hypothetical protein